MRSLTEYFKKIIRLRALGSMFMIFLLVMLVAFGAKAFAYQDDFKITTVFLVRHAEKASIPADDPPLLESGKARAEELLQVLQKAGVKRIYTSELLRTKQTAEPLAKHLGIESVTISIKNNLQESFKETARRIYENPGENILVVGHSNTVPEIIKALGVNIDLTIDEKEYDNLFVVTIYAKGQAKLTQLKYGKH